MIRKPPAGWQREENASVRTVRTVVSAAGRGSRMVRRTGHAAQGVFCFFIAIMWGFAALTFGLFAGSLPTFIGVGLMAALAAWGGRRAFAKAREISG